jgi:peptide chain release factor 2
LLKLSRFSRTCPNAFKPSGDIFDIDGKQNRLSEIEKLLLKPGLWDNPEESTALLKERSYITDTVSKWRELSSNLDEDELLLELALEENDEETLEEAFEKTQSLRRNIKDLELHQMLSGENDQRDAILSINAGAGGTEAQDWVEMLLRMYLRWCERKKFAVQIVDLQEGDEAGVKSTTLTVSGPYAYGLLKAESGIHRLVRISPFDASGRRHTSFAAVFVYPEVDDKIVVDIKSSDLRIDTFRASGAGGQHVNKTSSAIRITHLPTGIVVQCQNEKSQHRNRDIALKILRARLYEKEKRVQQEKLQEVHDNLEDIAWGNQIRSYVMQPYQLVKDHRTGLEKGNVEGVMDGDLDDFIETYLLGLISEKG